MLPVKTSLLLSYRKNISSNSTIFRLHYQFSSAILLAAALLVASSMGFGSPILCPKITAGLNAQDLQSYCMIHGIKLGDPTEQHFEKHKEEASQFNGLFKWAPLFLMAQSILFYIPHLVWKTYENGWIATLIKDLRATKLANSDEAIERMSLLALSFRNGKFNNLMYGLVLLCCEFANLINVSFQLYTMNRLVGNYLMENPTGILGRWRQDANERYDPIELTFPKMISCKIMNYGVSGTIETRETRCEAPINHLNEVIFIFSFYWMLFLFLCTMLHLLFFRILLLIPWSQKMLIKATCKGVPDRIWVRVFQSLGTFDLLVLRIMIAEMNEKTAQEFAQEIANQSKPRSFYRNKNHAKNEDTRV